MNSSETSNFFQQDQNGETKVSRTVRNLYYFRYAYARSKECQLNGDPGQDYLAFREDSNRLVFILCDGVSQSFIGDLAASFLGSQMLEWCWSIRLSPAVELQNHLQTYLNSLVLVATRKVADKLLPKEIPEMLRSVLEEKRVQGSETMLVGGIVDFQQHQAYLISLGDMRLRVWDTRLQEITTEIGFHLDTNSRWSTLRGAVGRVSVTALPFEEISCIAAYSDGLARIDGTSVICLSDDIVQKEIDLSFHTPSSDDISFFQICLGETSTAILNLPAPTVRLAGSEKERFVFWKDIAGAIGYEIMSASGESISVVGNSWPVPNDESKLGGSVKVRALGEDQAGEWSASVDLSKVRTIITPLEEEKPNQLGEVQKGNTEVVLAKPEPDSHHYGNSEAIVKQSKKNRNWRKISGIILLLTLCVISFALSWSALSPLWTTHTPTPTITSMPLWTKTLIPIKTRTITPTFTAVSTRTFTATPTVTITTTPIYTETTTATLTLIVIDRGQKVEPSRTLFAPEPSLTPTVTKVPAPELP